MPEHIVEMERNLKRKRKEEKRKWIKYFNPMLQAIPRFITVSRQQQEQLVTCAVTKQNNQECQGQLTFNASWENNKKSFIL